MKPIRFRCDYCGEMFKEIYNLKDGTKCCEDCYDNLIHEKDVFI